MRKWIFGILITIVVVGAVLLVDRSIRMNRSDHSEESAQTLPATLKLKSFPSGETVTLEKFAGKVLLINFWASWCEACMAEMPSIQKLYDTLKDKGLVVIAVNVDENPEKVVPQIVNKLHLQFPIFTDLDGELSKHFDVMAIPFSVVADRKMNIVWSESGERDWASEAVISEIRKLLDTKI